MATTHTPTSGRNAWSDLPLRASKQTINLNLSDRPRIVRGLDNITTDCSKCNKTCKRPSKILVCPLCKRITLRYHKNCIDNDITSHTDHKDSPMCVKCLDENIPFQSLNNTELDTELQTTRSAYLKKINNIDSNDNCKYYEYDQLSSIFKPNDNLLIIHINIVSLNKNFSKLELF